MVYLYVKKFPLYYKLQKKASTRFNSWRTCTKLKRCRLRPVVTDVILTISVMTFPQITPIHIILEIPTLTNVVNSPFWASHSIWIKLKWRACSRDIGSISNFLWPLSLSKIDLATLACVMYASGHIRPPALMQPSCKKRQIKSSYESTLRLRLVNCSACSNSNGIQGVRPHLAPSNPTWSTPHILETIETCLQSS